MQGDGLREESVERVGHVHGTGLFLELEADGAYGGKGGTQVINANAGLQEPGASCGQGDLVCAACAEGDDRITGVKDGVSGAGAVFGDGIDAWSSRCGGLPPGRHNR